MLRFFWHLLGFPFGKNVKILGSKKNLFVAKGVVFNGKVVIDLSKGGKVVIEENTVLMEGVILHPFGGIIEIGKHCSINPYCVLYGHGGLTIGDYVRIATHTVIIPANHIFQSFEVPIYKQGLSKKGIIILDDVWIGAGVKILDGVKIGKGSIIAAGAVINSEVPDLSIFGGVPAKKIGDRNKD